MQEYERLIGELKDRLNVYDHDLIDRVMMIINQYESKLEEQRKEYQAEKKAKEWAQREYARAQNQLEKTDYELQNTLNAQANTKEVIENYTLENKTLRVVVRALVQMYV